MVFGMYGYFFYIGWIIKIGNDCYDWMFFGCFFYFIRKDYFYFGEFIID